VDEPTAWRSLEDLARVVGWYAWTEHRLFEVTGAWAAVPTDAAVAPDVRVWCAAASRRHGALVGEWVTHLPVRAGVDAAALVTAPPGGLLQAFEALEAVRPAGGGVTVLVEAALPGLDRLYARHLGTAAPAGEAPVIESLVSARASLAGERAAGKALLSGMRAGSSVDPVLASTFEQAFEELRVFPAVRPS
jgi:hypothetical protein